MDLMDHLIYENDGPFDIRKSGGWPRMTRKHCKKYKNTQSSSDKSMYRWFKRIARRFGKQQTKNQD